MDQTIVIQYSLIASAIIAAFASIAAAFNDSKVAKAAIDGTTRQPEMAAVHQHAGWYRYGRIYSDYRYRYRNCTGIR